MATPTTSEPVGVGVAQEVEGRGEPEGRDDQDAGDRERRAAPSSRTGVRVGREVSAHASSAARRGAAGATGRSLALTVRPVRTLGQLASMSSRTPSSESGPPRTYSTIPVQKLPLPDLGGHQVGGVEPPGALRRAPSVRTSDASARMLVGVAVGPDFDVRRDAGRRLHAAHLALHVLGDEPLEEVDDLGPVAVGADDGELTGEEDALLVDRRAAGTSRSRRRPRRPPGRTGVDEARLAVQPAARAGRRTSAAGASPKAMSAVLVGAAEHVALGEHDLAERLAGRHDGRVVERDLVGDPLVVDVGPAVRSMMSSIQSVAGQPVAPPLSKPTHHGVLPSATIWSLRAMSSSQVVGDLVAGGVEVVLRVPDHALEVDVGRHAVVLALVLAERDERLADECRSSSSMSKPMSSSDTIWPCLGQVRRSAPGCGTAATSRVPPSARIWNCSSKSPTDSTSTVVVGLGVDQLVEDLLVGVDLLGLAGAHERRRSPLGLAAAVAAVAAVAAATAVVVVAARRGDEGRRRRAPPPAFGTSSASSPWLASCHAASP